MHSDAFLIKSYQIYQDRESLNILLFGCVWKWLVPHCTQWFCWSLSLWKMAISLGILTQHFQTNPFDLIHVEHCGTVWQKDEKHEALMKILETVQHQTWACNILYTVIIRLFWQSSMGFNDQRAVHLFLNSQLPQPPSNWDVAPKKIKVAKDKHKRIHLLTSFCGKLPSAICGFLTSVKPGFSVVSSGGPSDICLKWNLWALQLANYCSFSCIRQDTPTQLLLLCSFLVVISRGVPKRRPYPTMLWHGMAKFRVEMDCLCIRVSMYSQFWNLWDTINMVVVAKNHHTFRQDAKAAAWCSWGVASRNPGFPGWPGFCSARWVCLKIGYIPNYSHLIGIMIINHWV